MKTTEQFKSGALVYIWSARHFARSTYEKPILSEIRGADALGVWYSNKGDKHHELPVSHRFMPWDAIVEVEFL